MSGQYQKLEHPEVFHKRPDFTWWDPYGPVKYDLPDIFRNHLEILEKRLNEVELHLEQATGKAFVRAHERPAMSAEAMREMMAPIQALTERVGGIEKRLAELSQGRKG